MKTRKPARKAPARKKAPAKRKNPVARKATPKPHARAKAPVRRKVGSVRAARKPARRNPSARVRPPHPEWVQRALKAGAKILEGGEHGFYSVQAGKHWATEADTPEGELTVGTGTREVAVLPETEAIGWLVMKRVMGRKNPGAACKPAYRRNPGLEEAPLSDFKPRDAAEAKAVKKHARVYKDYHWGAPAAKVFRINDSLIPNLVAMGKLNQLNIGGHGMIDFPEGCWVAWDPKHPRKRLYLILTPGVREEFRNAIKHAEKLEPIQAIARRAGGEQAKYKLPAVKGVEIGPIEEIVYTTWKKGDDDDKGGCGYIHEFGGDGLSGYLPVLAADVSGRLWVCGGSNRTSAAGIVG